jgi:glutamyl-Q tRNA(Asp) synthetase
MATAPIYMHVPLVTHETGKKLSKQNLAPAVKLDQGLSELQQAASHLGLRLQTDSLTQFWRAAPLAWEQRLRRLPS